MASRKEQSDAKLQKLAAELSMGLALRARTEPLSQLAQVAGLPAGLVAGLTAHGNNLLSDLEVS